MSKKHHTPEQIISNLREVELLLSQGQNVPLACKRIEVSEQTYYNWQKEYGRGGIRLDQAKHFRELDHEDGRLKKLVADPSLDKHMLSRRSFKKGSGACANAPSGGFSPG